MALDREYYSGPFQVLGAADAVIFTLNGIAAAGRDPQVDIQRRHGAGKPIPCHVFVGNAKPQATISAWEIDTVLDNISPLTGAKILSSATLRKLDLYDTQGEDLGTRKSGSNHHRARCQRGMAIIQRITAQQGGDAVAEILVIGSFDGTTAPFTYADSVALPSVDCIGSMFTLGPVYLAGAVEPNVIGVTIDFGVTVEGRAGSGDPYDTYLRIKKVVPTITIQTTDARISQRYGDTGARLGTGESSIYFRKREKYGSNYPDADSEHIQIALSDQQGMLTPGGWSVSGDEPGQGNIILTPVESSSDAVLTYATEVTIPA